MWAIGVLDFGLSDDEFWGLDLDLFRRLAERKADIERRMDLRFGEVAATVANANRDPKKKKKPFRGDDFFPDVRKLARPIDREKVRGQLRALKAGLEDGARTGRIPTE
jgi:hypothetical protein